MNHTVEISNLLKQLVTGQSLSEDQAYQLFERIMTGGATDAQIGATLGMIQLRTGGPTVDEISGAARAMRCHARPVNLPQGMQVIDTCGTGGDGTKTFNISTTAALIAAGAGAKVAKHGNRSVTSNSGSSQVLEALGVNLMVTDAGLTRCLEEAGLCFCFAPAHHPAMKHAIGPRKELGFRTIFNMLGPLTNPAGAHRQVMGVFDPVLTATIANVLKQLGAEKCMVVHGSGLDEISTFAPTQISELKDGEVCTWTITPEELGINSAEIDSVKVDGVQSSAAMVRSVLNADLTPARDIAALNAAAALVVADIAEDLKTGLTLAYEAIDNGAALNALNKLCEVSHAEKA